VRCAGCYHDNPPGSAQCAGCGHELGLEPIAEPDTLRCRDCDEPFVAFHAGTGVLRDCRRCGGQLVDHALLRDLLERQENQGRSTPLLPRRPEAVDVGVRYIRCPICGQHMNRKNFAGKSGVIVDICREHGTWLDRGELPRLLWFAASGGMERARQRQRDEAQRARRDAERARAAARRADAVVKVSTWEARESALSELLELLWEITR
jgi:Zn-finger nucleic acid-binding protein